MAEIKWIKITTDIFDDEKIRIIEKMPEGDAILVIWLRLLTLAGKKNDSGMIYLTENIPYTPEILSDIFGRDSRIISLALNTFISFGMIAIEDDIIRVLNWDKHQNVEGMDKIREQTRRRVAKHRHSKQLEQCNVTVTQCNATDKIRIEEDKIRIEEKSIKKEKFPKHKFGEYKNVLLTDQEFIKLADEWGEQERDRMIEVFSEGLALKGYKYKSHYLAIRKWRKNEPEKPTDMSNARHATAPAEDNRREWEDVGEDALEGLRGAVRGTVK